MYQVNRVQESIDLMIDMKLSTAELKKLILKWKAEMAEGIHVDVRCTLITAANQIIEERNI